MAGSYKGSKENKINSEAFYQGTRVVYSVSSPATGLNPPSLSMSPPSLGIYPRQIDHLQPNNVPVVSSQPLSMSNTTVVQNSIAINFQRSFSSVTRPPVAVNVQLPVVVPPNQFNNSVPLSFSRSILNDGVTARSTPNLVILPPISSQELCGSRVVNSSALPPVSNLSHKENTVVPVIVGTNVQSNFSTPNPSSSNIQHNVVMVQEPSHNISQNVSQSLYSVTNSPTTSKSQFLVIDPSILNRGGNANFATPFTNCIKQPSDTPEFLFGKKVHDKQLFYGNNASTMAFPINCGYDRQCENIVSNPPPNVCVAGPNNQTVQMNSLICRKSTDMGTGTTPILNCQLDTYSGPNNQGKFIQSNSISSSQSMQGNSCSVLTPPWSNGIPLRNDGMTYFDAYAKSDGSSGKGECLKLAVPSTMSGILTSPGFTLQATTQSNPSSKWIINKNSPEISKIKGNVSKKSSSSVNRKILPKETNKTSSVSKSDSGPSSNSGNVVHSLNLSESNMKDCPRLNELLNSNDSNHENSEESEITLSSLLRSQKNPSSEIKTSNSQLSACSNLHSSARSLEPSLSNSNPIDQPDRVIQAKHNPAVSPSIFYNNDLENFDMETEVHLNRSNKSEERDVNCEKKSSCPKSAEPLISSESSSLNLLKEDPCILKTYLTRSKSKSQSAKKPLYNTATSFSSSDDRDSSISDTIVIQDSSDEDNSIQHVEIISGNSQNPIEKLQSDDSHLSSADSADLAISDKRISISSSSSSQDNVVLIEDSDESNHANSFSNDLQPKSFPDFFQSSPFSPIIKEKQLSLSVHNSEILSSELHSNNGQDVIRIKIDATLNKPYDCSGIEINVKNSSFQDCVKNNDDIIEEKIIKNDYDFPINHDLGENTWGFNQIHIRDCRSIKHDEYECDLKQEDNLEFNKGLHDKSNYPFEELKMHYKDSDVNSKSIQPVQFQVKLEKNYSDFEPCTVKLNKMEFVDSSQHMETKDFKKSDSNDQNGNISSNEDFDYEDEDKDWMEGSADSSSDSEDETPIKVQVAKNPVKTDKPFVCPHCGFGVAIESNLEMHIKAFHSDKKHISNQTVNVKTVKTNASSSVIIFKCTKCTFKTSQSLLLNKHFQTFHNMFVCTKCSFVANNNEDLKIHDTIHKTVKCELCDTRVLSIDYGSHLSSEHPVTFRFKCKSCEFKANAEWQLRNHKCSDSSIDNVIKKDSKDTKRINKKRCSFLCDVCNFCTSNESSLLNHKQLNHSQKKRFSCSHCNYRAESEQELKKHQYEEHPSKYPFKCKNCGFRTANRVTLNKHVKHFCPNNLKQEKCDTEVQSPIIKEGDELESSDKEMRNKCTSSLETTPVSLLNSKEFQDDYSKYCCSYCSFVALKKSTVSEHKYKMHSDKLPYSCRSCKFRSKYISTVRTHEKAVHKKKGKFYKLYHCKVCPFKTLEASVFIMHKSRAHGSKKRFDCAKCSYQTWSKLNFNRHIKLARCMRENHSKKVQQSKKPNIESFKHLDTSRLIINATTETDADLKFFYCTMCSFRVQSPYRYEIHLLSVHNKCLKCKHCPTFLNSFNELFVHYYEFHSSKYMHKCPFCCFCSHTEKDIIYHKKSFHQLVFCYYCDYSARSTDLMNHHILETHPERYPLFCKQCGYQTMNESFLRLHTTEMHPVIKCSCCDFVGRSKKDVLGHIVSQHPQLMKYPCPKCPFRAKSSQVLAKHESTCHDNKCDECDFLGTSTDDLGMHKFIYHHLNYKRYCVICGFRAARTSTIIFHELNVHFLQTYRCSACFFYSQSTEALSDHYSKCHMSNDNLTKITLNSSKRCIDQVNQSDILSKDMKMEESTCKRLRLAKADTFLGKMKKSQKECRVCDYRTVSSAKLYRHCEEKHPEEYFLRCIVCTHQLKSFSQLQSHLTKTHKSTKVFSCKFCPFVAQIEQALNRHCCFQHRELLFSSYECGLCKFSNCSIIALSNHCRQKHKVNLSSICHKRWKNVFLCSHCDFLSRNKTDLIQHLLICSAFHEDQSKIFGQKKLSAQPDNDKYFYCSLCKYSTLTKDELKRHGSLIHNTLNLYVCDWCRKGDYDLGSIIIHIEQKHEEDIRCPHCSFKSLFKTTLKDHILINHSSAS